MNDDQNWESATLTWTDDRRGTIKDYEGDKGGVFLTWAEHTEEPVAVFSSGAGVVITREILLELADRLSQME